MANWAVIFTIPILIALQITTSYQAQSHEEAIREQKVNGTNKAKTKGGHHGKISSNSTIESSTPKQIDCGKWYTSQRGEGCFDIAAGFGLTRDELKELNPTINCKGGLDEDSKICIRKAKKQHNSDEELEGLRDLMAGHAGADDPAIQHHFNVKMARGGK